MKVQKTALQESRESFEKALAQLPDVDDEAVLIQEDPGAVTREMNGGIVEDTRYIIRYGDYTITATLKQRINLVSNYWKLFDAIVFEVQPNKS